MDIDSKGVFFMCKKNKNCQKQLQGHVRDSIQTKMKNENIADKSIELFLEYLTKVYNDYKGIIPESDIEPLSKGMICSIEEIITEENKNKGKELLKKTVILKLNGGLGTGMGLDKAKSLIEVKKGSSYLDIIATQVRNIRKKFGIVFPILFMNSFATSKDTIEFIEKKYKDLPIKGLRLEMIQNKYPKIKKENFFPADHSDDSLNWNPPGHGDIYSTLDTTGLLDELLNFGIKYAFISNADNLGAVFSESIVGFMENEKINFVMETAKRTESDKKGGHLAKDKERNKLKLRERANCSEKEIKFFEDINKWSDFNTNNLWINLETLKTKLIDGKFDLDLIVNEKRNNPQKKEEKGTHEDNVKVYQLETAMGSAVGNFEKACAIRIDTTRRFFPTKKISDLMILRSDAIRINDDGIIELNGRNTKPFVELDKELYKTIDDLEELCQELPSLKDCDRLKVIGPGKVIFGKNVVLKGDIFIENKENATCKIENITLDNCSIIC